MDSDYPKIDYVMEREGLERVCKYSVQRGADVPENPHIREKRDYTKLIFDDITDAIGNTPMVRISNIAKKDNIKCELCKFLYICRLILN